MMVDIIIPKSHHKKFLTWVKKQRKKKGPRFRRKYELWCEESIGRYGIDWRILMMRQDPDAPDYALRCDRIDAIRFTLEFL